MGTAEMRVLVGIFCLVAMAAAMSPHGGACGRWSSSTCTCNPDSSSCAELAECMRSCTEQENEALLAYVRCTGSPCASATGCNVDCQGYPCHYCDNQGCCTSDTWGGHCAIQNVPGSSLQVMCTGVDTSEFGYTGGSSSEADCVDGDGNEVPFPETTCVPPGGRTDEDYELLFGACCPRVLGGSPWPENSDSDSDSCPSACQDYANACCGQSQ